MDHGKRRQTCRSSQPASAPSPSPVPSSRPCSAITTYSQSLAPSDSISLAGRKHKANSPISHASKKRYRDDRLPCRLDELTQTILAMINLRVNPGPSTPATLPDEFDEAAATVEAEKWLTPLQIVIVLEFLWKKQNELKNFLLLPGSTLRRAWLRDTLFNHDHGERFSDISPDGWKDDDDARLDRINLESQMAM